MKLSAVHPDEVLKIINELSNSSAFGMDEIDTYIIKLIRDEITPAITHIINLSLSNGEFPDAWKVSKVVPLYKKDDVLNLNNYRPIAIIPIMSKILERAMYNQLIKHFSENALLNPSHHAYRKNHSTATAMIELLDSWVQGVDSHQMVGVCFLDMSAAFDCVDHGILLQKLSLYGCSETINKWFSSYLSGRRQGVCINGTMSKLLPVVTGVPQGSILGPLLYTIYTNELPAVINGSHEPNQKIRDSICCYADDTTMTTISTDHTNLTEKLTANYNDISNFLIDNRLKLNDDKSHLMVITSSQTRAKSQSSNLVKIKTPLENIKPAPNHKLLGCIIQDDLKWTEQIRDNDESLIKSLNCRLNALKRISKISDFKTRKMIGNGIFNSKLIYMISIWSGCSKELINSLQIIQNRAARIITGNDWSVSKEENLSQAGWLSVNQLAHYHNILIIQQVIENRTPRNLYEMYNWNYQYQTRQAVSNALKPNGTPRLELTKKSFRWRAIEYYNKLPISITSISERSSFKIKLKIWLQDNVPFKA